MWNRNEMVFLGCTKNPDDAHIVLWGAPFDSTTSNRPGARFASSVMRRDSWGLETYSVRQDLDLEENACVCDAGDLELSIGSTELALEQITRQTQEILDDRKIPVMIGGEHLVTLGAVQAAAKVYPELAVIQLDAHTDLREDYLGVRYSHATVMRRICEIIGDHLWQYGIRSGTKSEFQFAAQHTRLQRDNLHGIENLKQELRERPVYLTIDLDVLDPGVFPGTGTPEPGGIGFLELEQAVLSLRGLHLIGCDLCELSPPYDHSGISAAAACKVLRELLLVLTH